TRPAPAQLLPDSARVRVDAPGLMMGRALVGTVIQAGPGLIVVQEQGKNGTVLEIPTSIISTLEVSRGRLESRSAAWRGVWRGGFAGTVMGGGVGFLLGMRIEDENTSVMGVTYRGMAIGALAGILTGTVAGSRSREQWERVQISPARTRDGVASISFSFGL
ncbi:MAG TPA: hypothetical protein VHG51_00450, partial [Longimicrobiaceae bacterium]|nr:hypothetical protein [Longimicrobiaceae bacterium]